MGQKIGSFIIDLKDKELSPDERDMLAHPLVGGIVLFARNYDSRQQLNHLCQQVRATRKAPLLIMVDQEGGRVQRFINEFTRVPCMALFGKLFDDNPDAACHLAKECAWLLAMELLSVGVDLSLAPVLDLKKGVSRAIGDRAFHANPQAVIRLSHAFMQGMQEAGMTATGKHFPGHGSVEADSHVTIPTDQRSLETIQSEDLIPFTALVKLGMKAIMAAHIVFPSVDTLPVGFSRIWLQDILRKKWGFTGVILSDDLNMEGANISANYADRVITSREAGCDFALLCNNHQGAIQVLDNVPHLVHSVGMDKWGPLQGDMSRLNVVLEENQRWRVMHDFLLNMTPDINLTT